MQKWLIAIVWEKYSSNACFCYLILNLLLCGVMIPNIWRMLRNNFRELRIMNLKGCFLGCLAIMGKKDLKFFKLWKDCNA